MKKTPLIFRDDSLYESDDEEGSLISEGESPEECYRFIKESTNDEEVKNIKLITDSNKKRKLQEEVQENIKTFSRRKLVIPISTNSYYFDNLNKDEFVKYDDDSSKAILDSELGVHANRKSKMRIKLSDTASGMIYRMLLIYTYSNNFAFIYFFYYIAIEDHDKSQNDPFSYTHETFIKPATFKSDKQIVETSGKHTKSKVPKSNVRKSVVGSKRNVKTDSTQNETKKRKRRIKKTSLIMKDGLSSQSTILTAVSTPEIVDEAIDDDMKKRYHGLQFIPITTTN